MSTKIVVLERHSALSDWISKKSRRLILLIGTLLSLSVAVNAMIILTAAGARLLS